MASDPAVTFSDVIDNTIPPTADSNEVKLQIIASIQTLKTKNRKCGKEEVF